MVSRIVVVGASQKLHAGISERLLKAGVVLTSEPTTLEIQETTTSLLERFCQVVKAQEVTSRELQIGMDFNQVFNGKRRKGRQSRW